MGVPIEISDELVEAAKAAAAARSWSVPAQIEHWAHLGRQLEGRRERRLEELGDDRYADLDAYLWSWTTGAQKSFANSETREYPSTASTTTASSPRRE